MSTIERKKWSSQGGLIALAVVALLGLSSPVARAESFTLTASGTSSGGNTVDATATVTITAGVIQISITDLLVNPTSDGQTINGIQFVLSSGQTTGTLASSSALHRLVTGNGVGDYSDSGPSSTTWNLNGNVSGGIELTSIGNMGGSPTIIGDPNAGNAYSSANGSIKNNHNFLAGTATYTVDVTGLLANATISSARFEFGTAANNNLTATVTPAVVPEPATILMMGLGLGAIGLVRIVRKAKTA